MEKTYELYMLKICMLLCILSISAAFSLLHHSEKGSIIVTELLTISCMFVGGVEPVPNGQPSSEHRRSGCEREDSN